MQNIIMQFLVKALVLCTAIPVHEFAHAFAADKMGDHTAKNMGRLTVNPVAHFDIMGSIMMVLCGFGWAKPVPINPRNFKNPKLGMAISSLAGPVSNLILAYLFMIIYKILFYTGVTSSVSWIFSYMVLLNIGLATFNLIPVPPLDGSRIATLFLSEEKYFKLMRYENIIFIALIAVVYSGILDTPLNAMSSLALSVMDFLTGYIDLIFVR